MNQNELQPGDVVTLVAIVGYNSVPISLSDTKATVVRYTRTGKVRVLSHMTKREYNIVPQEITELRKPR